MTADDAGGKPNFAGRRVPRGSAGGTGTRPPAAAMTARRSYTPTADEQAEMDALFFDQ